MSVGIQGLSVVRCPGLHLDSLGHYLAALGLLDLAARDGLWPRVRGAWRDGAFLLVGGPPDVDVLAQGLASRAAQGNLFREYNRDDWKAAQKESTKQRTGAIIGAWRNQCSEEECDLLDAHLLAAGRVSFNPLLGSGGNAGRRCFSKGWKAARDLVKKSGGDAAGLKSLLSATGWCAASGLNGESWFSEPIPPWAMLLACQGLPALGGTASRRLGANARGYAAFPFITKQAAPQRANEVGRVLAEFWAPVWERALAVAEVGALFARGRAEFGTGKPALTSAAFAAAAFRRGVDAGVVEFRRFLLTRTTSPQTFESNLADVLRVPKRLSSVSAIAVVKAVEVRNALPPDRKEGSREVFRGVQGPVDEAVIEYVARKQGGDPDLGWALIDALWSALEKTDRNSGFRAASGRFRLLPTNWLDELLEARPPSAEARIAMAIASIRRLGETSDGPAPFVAYRLGIEGTSRRWSRLLFPKEVPSRRVWSSGYVVRSLAKTLRRRIVDAASGALPCNAARPAPMAAIASFLRGELDDAAIDRWLGRMCVFDWERATTATFAEGDGRPPVDGALALYGFFKPLFHSWGDPASRRSGAFLAGNPPALRPPALSRIAALLDAGDCERAMAEARARYRAAGLFPAAIACPPGADTQRLLAALLIPCEANPLRALATRWLAPGQTKENRA